MSNRKTELTAAVATLKSKASGGVPKIGEIGLQDKTIYLNVFLGGAAGTINLVDANTRRLVGVTNLDGSKLNPGRDYIIDSIRFMNGNGGSTANTPEQNQLIAKSVDYTNGAIAVLRSAEFRITQGSNNLLDMPVSDLVGDIVTGTGASPVTAGFRNISTNPLLRSNQEFSLELEFPNGVVMPATGNGLCVRIEMRVHQAKR